MLSNGMQLIFHAVSKNARLADFQSLITAVEIDCAMLTVAQTYFGLEQSERLKVEIQDGLQFIKNSANAG
jgi:spermidine synthase